MSQLDHWRDVSSSVRGSAHEATFRPSNISMARYLFTCAQMGMRVGESESRLKTDLLQVRDGWVLMVRPRRRSPLKTLASYRALTLENHLSESDAQVILDTFSGMKDSNRSWLFPMRLTSLLLLYRPLRKRTLHVCRPVAMPLLVQGSRLSGRRAIHTLGCQSLSGWPLSVIILPRFSCWRWLGRLGMQPLLRP